jgi:hypothetical protein
MNKALIPLLAEILELYYSQEELMELASVFDVTLPDTRRTGKFNWLTIARQLIEQIDTGNHYAMLASLLPALEQRNKTAIARTDWERRDAHEHASPKIDQIVAALAAPGIAKEIVVAENKPFSAKAEVREFLEKATTPLLVVDPYIGLATLDCLRTVRVAIFLLTGAQGNAVESGFHAALKAFQSEGFEIEVRQHPKLHDRHFVFNDRCWLVGSSLKDAGRKAFHVTEIVDAKPEVIAALTTKWNQASPFPIQKPTP